MESAERPTHMSLKPQWDLRLGDQGLFGATTCCAERSCAMMHRAVGSVIDEPLGDQWRSSSKDAECVRNRKRSSVCYTNKELCL